MLTIRFENTEPEGIITQEFIRQIGDIPEIRKIEIEEGIVKIDEYAFTNYKNIKEIRLPESLIEIGQYAFYDCKCLRNINFGRNLERIGYRAFKSCILLDVIDFSLCPDCKIGTDVFSYCSSLSNVILPNNLEVIEQNLFNHCISLTNIEIPETISTIAGGAFQYCDNLESIYIPDNVIQICAEAFSYCSGLTNVRLSRNLRVIEKFAFDHCESLVSMYVKREEFGKVIFPDSLEIIDNSAFRCCSEILMIRFSKYIQVIEFYAFDECLSLQTVIFDSDNHGLILRPTIFKNCDCLEYVLLPENIRPHNLFSVFEIPRYTFSSQPNSRIKNYIQEQLENKRVKEKFRNQKQEFSEYLNPKLRHSLSFSIMLSYMSDFNNTIDENIEYSRYHMIVETILS